MFPDKLTLWIVKACVLLALLLALLLGAYLWAFSRGEARAEAKQAKADAKAAVIARAREDALNGVIWDTNYAATETRRFRELQTARTIACLRDGSCRMRDRFTCPRLPGAAQAAPGNDDSAAFGLQVEDGEFLVREASRADGVADQLRQCQAVATAYWKATQP